MINITNPAPNTITRTEILSRNVSERKNAIIKQNGIRDKEAVFHLNFTVLYGFNMLSVKAYKYERTEFFCVGLRWADIYTTDYIVRINIFIIVNVRMFISLIYWYTFTFVTQSPASDVSLLNMFYCLTWLCREIDQSYNLFADNFFYKNQFVDLLRYVLN